MRKKINSALLYFAPLFLIGFFTGERMAMIYLSITLFFLLILSIKDNKKKIVFYSESKHYRNYFIELIKYKMGSENLMKKLSPSSLSSDSRCITFTEDGFEAN